MIDERDRDVTPTRTWTGDAVADGGVPVFPERWRLDRLVGSGGQADVWLARDEELGEWVAIKLFRGGMSLAARERLRREVRLGRALQHGRLVRVYELLELGGRLAVVMEWVSGGSLGGRIARERQPVDEVVRVAEETLEVLAYIHEQGVVHRDVKPSNLLFDEQGDVRLVDLGLARRVEDQGDLTRTAMAVGTPSYMSPEQIRGQRAVPASDLYALGVTLYQMLTGRMPFEAESEYELAQLHLRSVAPDVRGERPDCPKWLAQFIGRLLEKRPEDRFADGGAALAALHHRRVGRSGRWWRRLGVGAAAGVAAAAVLVFAMHAAGRARIGSVTRVDVHGTALVGLDRVGKEAWRLDLGQPISDLKHGDLDGDGKPEWVATTAQYDPDENGATPHSRIVIVRRDGTIVSDVLPDAMGFVWVWEYPKQLMAFVSLQDVDGDGVYEVVLRCVHRTYFPSAVAIYWGKTNRWEPILVHAGALYAVSVVPGSHPPRLRLAGVNNRLGMLPIVGELQLSTTRRARGGGEPGLLSSPESGPPDDPVAEWNWYTLLPQGPLPRSLEIHDNGSTDVVCGTTRIAIDRWGNPATSPNAGKDIRDERMALLEEISRLQPDTQSRQPEQVEAARKRIVARFSNLLREPPERAAVDLASARALARVGRLDEARQILLESEAAFHYEDTAYRLAHLDALAGRLRPALAVLAEMIANRQTSRGGVDASTLALRIATELRDRAAIERILALSAGWAKIGLGKAEILAALVARVHLWWDEVTPGDEEVASWSLTPAGSAIACLGRWRAGHTRPGDAEAMIRLGQDHPEAAWESRIARGAALLGTGKAGEAVGVLSATVSALQFDARDDFSNHQLLELAQALYCRALLAGGEEAAAVSEARRVRPTMRTGLLPAKIVDEVLAEASLPSARPAASGR